MPKSYVKTHPNNDKKPAAPKRYQLSEMQQESVNSLHLILKQMSLKFSFDDCVTALQQYDYDIDKTADHMIDGEFKPWKTATNARFGGHKQRKSNQVVLTFNSGLLIKDEIKEGLETYNDIIEIVPEQKVSGIIKPDVEYVETEEERQNRIAVEEMKKIKAAEKKAKQVQKKAQRNAEKSEITEPTLEKAEPTKKSTVKKEQHEHIQVKVQIEDPEVIAPQPQVQIPEPAMCFNQQAMPPMIPGMMPPMPQMMPGMPQMMPGMMPPMPQMMPGMPQMMPGMMQGMYPQMMPMPNMQQVFMMQMPNGTQVPMMMVPTMMPPPQQ
ncbi:hypothetical protein SS50377_25012 [Spironucleus salmonicida]|uniref:Uncharacterized protein n=1 Tax=Spironucleus salmonicida TaxID=348837 RepID=V6LUZ0_9EUKA|nr:hypothetical protein SS50377_25012 [Spironucleus salmonicida]|eukprot:EST48068.1 Hypothetical protein SS50377_11797 [Spironucleus salmonicida]